MGDIEVGLIGEVKAKLNFMSIVRGPGYDNMLWYILPSRSYTRPTFAHSSSSHILYADLNNVIYKRLNW